jgi:hypothetical protein
MQAEEVPTELLMPPKRLGSLLAAARVSRGFSLVEAAEAAGGQLSSRDLLEVETGCRQVLDPELRALTGLYGIPTTSLIPERSILVIDLDEGVLAAGAQRVVLGGDVVQEREVLGRYLAMLYAMRGVAPGQHVTLRAPDLEVLGTALRRPAEQLESELLEMMVGQGIGLEPRIQRLRGRVLIPAIGLVVAATAAGLLLLVANDSDATPVPVTAEVEIGDAVVQERLPDGTPGPVQVRD